MMNKQDKIITGLIVLILFIVWSKFMVASGYAGTTPILTEVTSYPISLGKDIVLANWQVVAAGVGTPSSGVTVASNPLGDSTVSNNQLFDAQLAPAAQWNLQWGDVNRQCWSDITNKDKIIGFRKELKSGGGGKLWYLYSADGKMPATGNQAQTAVTKSLGNVGGFSIPQYLVATKSRSSPSPDGNCTYRIVAVKACSQQTCTGGVGTQSQILQLIKKADPGGVCVGPDNSSDLTQSGASVVSITANSSSFKATDAASGQTTTTQTTTELTSAVSNYTLGYFSASATEGATCMFYASTCAAPGCKGGLNFIQNSGTVQTIAGAAGAIAATGTDGVGSLGATYSLAPTFYTPSEIAVGGAGSSNVFVLDTGSNKIRNLYSNTDGLWQTVTVPTFAPQAGNNLKGICADFLATSPNIYVTESGTGTSRVSQVTPAGSTSSYLAITSNPVLGAVYIQGGDASGPVVASSNVWFVSGNNIGLIRFAAGGILTGGSQYVITTNESSPPTSITATSTTVYYTIGHCVKKFPLPATVSTQTVSPTIVAGDISTSGGYKGSEVGAAARFNTPIGLTVDINGNIYVADSGNNVIRKIDGTGAVTVFVGGNKTTSTTAQVGTAGSDDTGTAAGTTPGGGATFSGPKDISIDTYGNMYVADTGNNIIRRIV